MGGDYVVASAFLMESEERARPLGVVVGHPHGDRGRDTREAVDQHAEERAVAQARERREVDAIEKGPGLCGREHRGLAGLDDVLGAAHRARGVEGVCARDCGPTVCRSSASLHQPAIHHWHTNVGDSGGLGRRRALNGGDSGAGMLASPFWVDEAMPKGRFVETDDADREALLVLLKEAGVDACGMAPRRTPGGGAVRPMRGADEPHALRSASAASSRPARMAISSAVAP